MENKYCMITTTFDNLDEAKKNIEVLLKSRLVSCCQLQNINSTYHWKGNIENTNEYLLQMKTKKSLYDEVEKTILELHSYETPQIVCFDIAAGYKGYLNWIEEETK